MVQRRYGNRRYFTSSLHQEAKEAKFASSVTCYVYDHEAVKYHFIKDLLALPLLVFASTGLSS